jgi:L-arabinokinase
VVVAFYISGHGLGHASRDLVLVDALRRRRSDIHVVVRTSAARWFFDATAPALDVQACETDTGVVQIDSLRLDEAETIRRAAAFYRDFDRRAGEEARWLETAGARLVLGDVPPLAFAAAARAGLPSVAIGNFTWDWIYAAYPGFAAEAPHVIPTIRQAYAEATIALRLPLHGGFEAMTDVRDLPLIARRSMRDRQDTRRRLGLDGSRPVVLSSFGGYGATLPYDRLARDPAFALVTCDREPPDGLDYEDLVAAADVVVSKPGYGIVSECAANGAALLYTSRGRFAEYDVFVEEMPRLVRCRFLPQADLFAGDWGPAVAAVLAQPAPPPPAVDGAERAADIVASLCPA